MGSTTQAVFVCTIRFLVATAPLSTKLSVTQVFVICEDDLSGEPIARDRATESGSIPDVRKRSDVQKKVGGNDNHILKCHRHQLLLKHYGMLGFSTMLLASTY